MALTVELETLKKFKGRVDGLLTKLDGSHAAPTRIAEERLTAAHLGTGFGEATTLHSTYEHVHGELETFSRLLSDQIEAMGTAVHGARVGYENVDYEHRDRMWAIQTAAEKHYDPKHDPHAPKGGTHGASNQSAPAKEAKPSSGEGNA
ncbi:hypothetical protein [Streptomyces sp. H27-D2]|uniref:hypothetical protein n=1 Tax=Streptomyces sp. H27-D2 TaxID=3046304 RepID=UPI002DB9FD2B|nr:hypothetical protein [Streptomyces sp. H27-D2]MEC4017137.1 hypothetical protein [Streptomyces sp. H27-D2]